MAKEENWVYESDSDDYGETGNACLMADVEASVPMMSKRYIPTLILY